MSQVPILRLNNVGVNYKQSGNIFRKQQVHDVLKSVSFDVYPGETLGIIGNNGAGKSTLLKIISGIIKPNVGTIQKLKNTSISLLGLQSGFDTNLSGQDNAILSGMLQGISKKKILELLDDIHSFSELGDYFYEPVRTYSNGMRLRLGFSISLFVMPDIILMDEVLAVGDQHFREKAEKAMVSKIQSEQTVVLVSHSLHQISRLCDRAVIINNGISIERENLNKTIGLYKEMVENQSTKP